jgi:hypothetical protein
MEWPRRATFGLPWPAGAAVLTAMRALAVALLAASLAGAIGCALGPEQEPGCHDDADCGEGVTCRAGACFWTTTPGSPSDAGGEAGDGG